MVQSTRSMQYADVKSRERQQSLKERSHLRENMVIKANRNQQEASNGVAECQQQQCHQQQDSSNATIPDHLRS